MPMTQLGQADLDAIHKEPSPTIVNGVITYPAPYELLVLAGAVPRESYRAMRDEVAAVFDEDDDGMSEAERNCPGHEWAYTGTQYGGDDESYHGEGRCYCIHCGADGDA